MSKSMKLVLVVFVVSLTMTACGPVFAQETKPAPAKLEDKSIPLPADKAKALEEVKAAFEKSQKDAELAQAKLDAAKANIEKAQLQFVLIIETAKKETKCDDCQLSEDGKSLKRPDKTAQAKP